MIGIVGALVFRVKSGIELWWMGLLLLPVNWVFGWLLVLKPLNRARTALRAQ